VLVGIIGSSLFVGAFVNTRGQRPSRLSFLIHTRFGSMGSAATSAPMPTIS